MSIEEALKFVEEMKKRGATEFSYENLTVKFDVHAVHVAMDTTIPESVGRELTEEEKLALPAHHSKTPGQKTDEDLYWSV